MDINFKCGYYIQNRLWEISADLNVDKQYYSKLKKLLEIKQVEDFALIRVGLEDGDGGYIMLNDFQDRGVAYSFGISNDVTWDNIMAELGYDIYMYDHTITNLPYERKEFHFFREGISGENEKDQPLKTLEYFIERNNHVLNKNMILKMDVEGAEWDFLETVDSNILNQFDQIVFEMHNIIHAGYGDKILRLLDKINETHAVVHVHGNNSGWILTVGNTIFPDVLEITYVNKNKYKIMENKDICLPLQIDSANDRGRKDIILGDWNKPLKI